MTEDKKVPPMSGTLLAHVKNILNYKDVDALHTDQEPLVGVDADVANVMTSKLRLKKDKHKVVLDIDLPAQLLPSSTPGHFHLLIDHEVPWDKYVNLLNALAEAGVIEEGYAGASIARGWTAVRLPWVKKPVEYIKSVDD